METDHLNFDILKKLIADLAITGKWRISITGGEPFLYKNLESLMEEIVHHNFPFCITTNGTQPINKLKNIPNQFWKNGTIKVSIDGNKFIHDKYRGRGNFDKAINFIKEARQIVPRLIINTVLIEDCKIWAEEIYDVLADLKVDRWTILSPVKTGSWDTALEKLIEDSYSQQYEFIKNISLQSNKNLDISFFDKAKIFSVGQDLVYLKSNGQVFLPGILNSVDLPPKIALINSPNIVDKITNSVNCFINQKNYIQ